MAIATSDGKTKGFNQWLLSQVDRMDVVGKFARVIKLDRCWPRDADDYIILRSHIRVSHYNNSYANRIAAFEIAWEEYQSELFRTEILSTVETTMSSPATQISSKKEEVNVQQPLVTSKS